MLSGGSEARASGTRARKLPTTPTTPAAPAPPTAREGQEPPSEPIVPPAAIMPPYRLPAEHFFAALGWLALGALGLVAIAPELAAGAYLTPRAAAVTHCFTLGWVTTSIFGALYQIYPVALGVGARSTRVGHLTFWTLQAGILFLVAGAWWWNPNLLGPGWLMVFLATIALRVNIVACAKGTTRAPIVGRYATAAVGSLVLALAVIGVSIGTFAGWWASDRMAVLTAHAHLAAVGFATLMAIGVGGKLLPMFLYARDLPEWPLSWIGPLVGGGVLMFSVATLLGEAVPALRLAGGLAMAGGLGLYLGTFPLYFRRGVRDPGPGLYLAAVAHLFLLAALVLGLFLLLTAGADARVAATYGLVGIVGWLTLFVAGVYHRILPFLTWLERFSSRVGTPGVPKVADLTKPRLTWAAHTLLAVGAAALSIAVFVGSSAGARAGAAVFALGALTLLGMYLDIVRRR